MSPRNFASLVLLAMVALATGFVLAGQVRTQLLPPSNQVARYQALVRSVQELEATNAGYRREAHAGLIAMHGPGVEVELRNGVPGPDTGGLAGGYLVNFQDVQDVVNLLFAQGAEAIAVNGRRITPLTAFSGSAGQVVIDQGPPLSSPIKIAAVGDRNRMVAALGDSTALPDIRAREVQYQLHLSFQGSPDLSLPAYDSSLQIPHVNPT